MASMRVEANVTFIADPEAMYQEIKALDVSEEALDIIRRHFMRLNVTEHIPYAELLSVPFPQELIQYTADKMKQQLADDLLSKTGMIHLEQEGEWPPLTN